MGTNTFSPWSIKSAHPASRHLLRFLLNPQNVAVLRDRGSLIDDRAIDLFLNSTMSGVDNFFIRTRRRLSLLERAITTPSAGYRAWYGYSPYNPAMVKKMTGYFSAI